MTESELLAEITRICDCLSPPVRWVHFGAKSSLLAARSCPWVRGWPDLLLAGTAAVVWRELKAGSTRVTAVQASWLDHLENAGQDVAVWNRLDLYDGTIEQQINALNGQTVPRRPWIPPGATPAETDHRHALYGSPEITSM